MKRIAIYPGSFDPITNGHLDIIHRAKEMFDTLIVAIAENPQKTSFFTVEERLQFLKASLGRESGIQVQHFSGLLAHFVQKTKASAVIRGLRAVSDFEYEFQMALMNRKQYRHFETVFLMPDERYTYLSSRMVREVSRLGGTVHGLVPEPVEKALLDKFAPSLTARPK